MAESKYPSIVFLRVYFPFLDEDVLTLHPIVYTFRNLFVLQEYVLMLITSTRNNFLNSKLLKQGYRYHKLRKAFSKFYTRHSELIVKYNICFNTLLHQGISESVFQANLVYKFKRIVGKPDFSDQFKTIIKCYKRV